MRFLTSRTENESLFSLFQRTVPSLTSSALSSVERQLHVPLLCLPLPLSPSYPPSFGFIFMKTRVWSCALTKRAPERPCKVFASCSCRLRSPGARSPQLPSDDAVMDYPLRPFMPMGGRSSRAHVESSDSVQHVLLLAPPSPSVGAPFTQSSLDVTYCIFFCLSREERQQ